jgi:hypothetical protein
MVKPNRLAFCTGQATEPGPCAIEQGPGGKTCTIRASMPLRQEEVKTLLNIEPIGHTEADDTTAERLRLSGRTGGGRLGGARQVAGTQRNGLCAVKRTQAKESRSADCAVETWESRLRYESLGSVGGEKATKRAKGPCGGRRDFALVPFPKIAL